MRLSVATHALGSHVQQLRNCFATGGRSPVSFEIVDNGAGVKLVVMSGSPQTKLVVSDREISEHAIMLHTRAGRHSIWLAFNEVWKTSKKSVVFVNAGFRVYLAPYVSSEDGSSTTGTARQLMRVEWEGKNVEVGQEWTFPAPGAGHPHVQFDRCSIPLELNSFSSEHASLQTAREFPAQSYSPASTTQLDWFHKLHFPLNAPWHKEPYTQELTEKGLDDLPHTVQPSDLGELESWIKSVTRYLKEQFSNYS